MQSMNHELEQSIATLETQAIHKLLDMLINELDSRSGDPDREMEPQEDSDDDADEIDSYPVTPGAGRGSAGVWQ